MHGFLDSFYLFFILYGFLDSIWNWYFLDWNIAKLKAVEL